MIHFVLHSVAECHSLDLRNHYVEVHKRQRLYACRLCNYKAQVDSTWGRSYPMIHCVLHSVAECHSLDLRNHYVEVHKRQRLYACRLCNYKAQVDST